MIRAANELVCPRCVILYRQHRTFPVGLRVAQVPDVAAAHTHNDT